jgi:hypothetical protein
MDENFIGLAAVVLVFLIPIVAILVKHQQRMAEIIHSKQPDQSNVDVHNLRAEVHQLREIVHLQSIQMDTLLDRQRLLLEAPKAKEDLSARLES